LEGDDRPALAEVLHASLNSLPTAVLIQIYRDGADLGDIRGDVIDDQKLERIEEEIDESTQSAEMTLEVFQGQGAELGPGEDLLVGVEKDRAADDAEERQDILEGAAMISDEDGRPLAGNTLSAPNDQGLPQEPKAHQPAEDGLDALEFFFVRWPRHSGSFYPETDAL
jgi:hypothetical protein